MTLQLFRVFDWDNVSKGNDPGGPFYIPRDRQGPGRFDVPHLDGVLYASTEEKAAIVEAIQAFRSRRLTNRHFERPHHRRQALARFEIDAPHLTDLDDPAVLQNYHLRPSEVLTFTRSTTHAIAERFFNERVDGLLWPSAFEASWKNIALFQSRAQKKIRLADIHPLSLSWPPLMAAAEWLNIQLVKKRGARRYV